MKLFYALPAGLLALGTLILLGGVTRPSAAFPDYSNQTGPPAGGTGCKGCHGDFRQNNYVSWADGQAWQTSLMSGHNNFLNECDACHKDGRSGFPVFLNASDGAGGLAPIGCLGCHGRNEGGTVTGAGLRQHHWIRGVQSCGNAGCHPGDSNPSVFTTVNETVLPPFYANPAGHANIPKHPCNLASLGYSEDVRLQPGTGGLDNDGDGLYDTNDPECSVLVPSESATWGRIKALYKSEG